MSSWFVIFLERFVRAGGVFSTESSWDAMYMNVEEQDQVKDLWYGTQK